MAYHLCPSQHMLLIIPEKTPERLLVGERSVYDGSCFVKEFRLAISRNDEGELPCLSPSVRFRLVT